VRKEGYALLDANLYPKPSTTIQLVGDFHVLNTSPHIFQRHKSIEDVGKDIMTYLWDNYIQCDFHQFLSLPAAHEAWIVLGSLAPKEWSLLDMVLVVDPSLTSLIVEVISTPL
jgi:hypothetical protein